MQKTGTPNEYRRELKKKILSHTMNEFHKYGIRAVKMDDVARQLGISKRTVYEIYQDKEAILLDGLKRQYELGNEKIRALAGSSANVIELLATFYKIHMVETAKISPDFYVDVKGYPEALKFFEEKGKERDKQAIAFFRRGVEEGYFREDIDYDIMMKLGNITNHSVMEQQLFNKYSMQKLTRNIMVLYIRGFCTPKGVELFDELTR